MNELSSIPSSALSRTLLEVISHCPYIMSTIITGSGPVTETKVKLLACRNVAIRSNFYVRMLQLIRVSMTERGNSIQVLYQNVATDPSLYASTWQSDPNHTS